MFGIAIVFGGSLLIAGTMISPDGLHIRGLVSYAAIMLVIMPFAAWQIFATQLVLPTAGPTRMRAVFNTWVGGTLTAVCAIFFIASVLGYPGPDARIDPSGHLLIPFMPRFGLCAGALLPVRVRGVRYLGRDFPDPPAPRRDPGCARHRMRLIPGHV